MLKRLIRRWILNILKDTTNEFKPVKSRDLKAVSFESKIPGINGNLLCQCTQWDNGEGYDFSICDSKGNEKRTSLHVSEIDLVIACLNDLKYFEG